MDLASQPGRSREPNEIEQAQPQEPPPPPRSPHRGPHLSSPPAVMSRGLSAMRFETTDLWMRLPHPPTSAGVTSGKAAPCRS